MNEVFSIQVHNRQFLEQGKQGVWLDLPTTTETLQAALRDVGITADNPQDFFINGYSCPEDRHLAIPYDMVLAADVDELNFLAARLGQLDAAEIAELNAALQNPRGGFENIGQIIDYTENVDYYVHLPDVRGDGQLGDYYLNRSGMVDMPEEWKAGIDTAQFGRHIAQQEQGVFTQYGYLVRSGDEWQRVHEGQPVPEEYRVMHYPQPEADREEPQAQQPEASESPDKAPPPVIPIMLDGMNSKERMKVITDRLETGVQELFESSRYMAYLSAMSKMHDYSLNNTLLIAMQGGSIVAGYNRWQDEFDRHVKRGEKGIKILAPAPFKVKQQMEKTDPATQQPVIGADGKPVTEEQEVTVPAFKVVTVFDISQTEGKDFPMPYISELTGDVQQYQDFFAALERTSPYPISIEPISDGAKGRCFYAKQRIAINEGMSELQTLKTAIHEIAHAKLHAIDREAPAEEQAARPDRSTREVQAESVAYTVCQYYGLDTSDYSFGYVADWSSGRELSELKASLETIRATASELITEIDGHFAQLQQEREARQEQEAVTVDVTPEAAAPAQAEEEQAPALDPAAEPLVTVLWSESPQLKDGQQMPLHEADALFARLDAAYPAEAGYDKTAFRIDCIFQGEPDSYEGRQDFGDRDGSLIEHIQSYHQFYAQDENWKKHVIATTGIEGWEQDKAHRDMLLGEFVPYMKLHCSLAQMEQTAQGRLQSGETLTPEETAYLGALLSYVQECRPMLNQGQYQLPEPPKLADFDQSLQDYKAQVQAEIAQEAAAAGMTVEEYAAAGYEAPQQDTFSIYQLRGGEETRDYRVEPYERLQAAGLAVDSANYDLVYTAPLDKSTSLEDIYRTFNIDHPADFRGHSLSVSDVVVLHQNGQDTAHYVDSFGYMEVPEFLRENPLRTAELSTEQNENMIDGIINNTPPEPQPEEPEQLSFEDVAVASGQTQEEPPEAAPPQTAVRYYPINEGAARRAKEAMSFSDYRPGSATAEYRHYVDQAVEIAERQKKRVEPEYHEKIDSLLDTYARKLAENMNKGYEITARVPSVLIAGPSNFPVRAKEKQNAASDRNMEEFQYIQGLLDKIRSTGMGGISADDPQAVSKLEKKLEKLEASQELMKAVNAYYRKHGTLDGCPHLIERGIENLKADMASGWHYEKKPFQSWQLSNNNAEIRRLKGRIEELTRQKEAAYVGWEFDGGTVEINRVANRLQIFFEGKPDAAVRDELKSNGFRWSPKAGAWQRQLNDTTIRVADRIKCIQPLSGEKPSALQLAARREKEKPSIRAQLNAAKTEQAKQPPAREKSKGLEVE
ncbi:YodL domain-containing protein [Enterococcus faecium]|uniref:YodL domain-containing protein n=1 Tax=Enterococcus faecium TaxID=1352 RepID=UPI0007F4D213|nr:YodL domain-containing protein [Enterococcus faecium]SAM38862.1 Antirestriction protein (ArdA) [Enterococcus faecium]